MTRGGFWYACMWIFIFAALVPHAGAQVEVPENVTLSAELNSITVNWEEGDADADSYIVYWGTDAGNLNNQAEVDDSAGNTESYVIENLESGTTYYVAVSAVDNNEESNRTAVRSIATDPDTSAPAVPTGFRVTDPAAIAQTEVPLQWDANTETDLDLYRIDYGTASGTYGSTVEVPAENQTRTTVSGLQADTRYYFVIRAVDASDNASAASDELIADTLPDTHPPFPPAGVSALMSGAREVTVSAGAGNENMADFAGNIVFYGMNSGTYTHSADIGKSSTHVITGLPENTTWFFAVRAYDINGNESGLSAEISVDIEAVRGYLGGREDFDSGCFISSLSDTGAPETDPPENRAGISAGYLMPSDSDFEEFYGNDVVPVFLFYDRSLTRHLSFDVRAGYMEEEGRLQTVSGVPTRIKTRFTAIPVSASINYNFRLAPSVWAFVGMGPDYWHCREDPDISGPPEDVSKWVGGWHGRTGVWLYNRDPQFSDWGALVECGYFRIDRFGGNSVDPGGWLFLLGLFYGF